MKTLATIWLTAIGTFTFFAIYLLASEKNINAPGELSEWVSGAGSVLFLGLLTGTTVVLIVHYIVKYFRDKK